jgi:hypothetical protein
LSIGIAVTLPDGALLVADGRRNYPLASATPPADDIDKIEPVDSMIYAIPFGIVQATNHALACLRARCHRAVTVDAFEGLLDDSVREGWTAFLDRLAKDVDRSQPFMKAALITAGIIAGQPFVAGCLYGSNTAPSLVVRKDSAYSVFSLGGEEERASERFTQEAQRTLVRDYQRCSGPLNTTVNALLASAAATIQGVGVENPKIGGTIRYAVVRSGFPVHKGIWSA